MRGQKADGIHFAVQLLTYIHAILSSCCSQGKGKGTPHPTAAPTEPPCDPLCNTIHVYFHPEDYSYADYENKIGFGLAELPFYDEHGNQLGTYSDFATVTGKDSEECVGRGAYSFDFDEHIGFYLSTINMAYTCSSDYNTITGGSGDYGCASGYEYFDTRDDSGYVDKAQLTVCGMWKRVCTFVLF